ncbi:hypothetical protein NDU88_010362 [Pleurodeles waltl]|uniref:Thyroid peroxidase n=1 Tax=Pleurodeles waltl TaxID=8319 RepID=A0AAV7PY35_PLEWA|nr:hypothetical protein NDU88_010362 [Pleurodeles waltl]
MWVRDVSNRVVRYLDERGVLDQERSQLFTVWGQWVDHDLDFSPESPMASPSKTREECTTTCAKEANCFPIMIITFRDYLPNLLGDMYKREIPEYSGYDEYEDPRVANIFSIAFRFGHATVSPFIFRLDNNYRPRGNNYKVPLHKIFFATWRVIKEGGIDPLLRGLLANEAKLNIQNKMLSDELRERLFENPQTPGLDLASFNMQRGRDHGLVGNKIIIFRKENGAKQTYSTTNPIVMYRNIMHSQ